MDYLNEIRQHLSNITKKKKKNRIFMENKFHIRFVLLSQER